MNLLSLRGNLYSRSNLNVASKGEIATLPLVARNDVSMWLWISLFLACPLSLWADSSSAMATTSSLPDVTMVASTAPANAVALSTGTTSYISTGESVENKVPLIGIDQRPAAEDIFVTLTRNAYKVSGLPTDTEIITPEEFTRFDAQDAGEALQHATGIQALSLGSHLESFPIIGIRGSTMQETLILVDGRPMGGVGLQGFYPLAHGGINAQQDLSEIPIEQIDHIEIVRGGLSALYGPNAMGGVINIITKRALFTGHPLSHVSYESGAFKYQTYRLDFANHSGPLDYAFYGDQSRIGGFRNNSDAFKYNIGGNMGLGLGKAGRLLFDASSFHKNAAIPGQACGPDDPNCLNGTFVQPNQFNNNRENFGTSPTAHQITDTDYLRTSYIASLPHHSFMTVRLFATQRQIEFDDLNNPNPLAASQTIRHEQSKGTDTQVNLPLGFVIGGSFVHDREANTDFVIPSNAFIRSVEDWGFYAEETLHHGPFTLIPSGRLDHHSTFGDTTNPRVQLLADATDWLRFAGSAGRSFRAPTIDELYFVGPLFNGNPNLLPETAWTYDAGFEIHKDSFSLKTTYFRSNVSNLIQMTPDASTEENVGVARRQGAEVELHHVWNARVKDSWNYTYLQNLGTPAGFTGLVPLAYSPHDTINYILSIIPKKRWKLDSVFQYEDARYSGNNKTGTRLGSQFVYDPRLTYALRQLDIYLGIHDLFNRRYEEVPGFPLPGRTIYAGLSLRLWD